MGESSAVIQGRVETAREIQRRRYTSTGLACNADMRPARGGRIDVVIIGTAQEIGVGGQANVVRFQIASQDV